jgi:nucleoside phosphorylase
VSAAILVVAAMPEELAPLRAALPQPSLTSSLILAVTGDGERRAGAAAAALIAETGARALIAVGVAGALSDGLEPGHLVVARRVVREAGDGVLDADGRLWAAAAHAAEARPGIAVSAARLADSAAEKRRLLELARARGGGAPDAGLAAVVDLESAAYAGAAAAAGIPWLVLRAVSDTAEEELPALLGRSVDDSGAVRRGRVLMGLLGEPSAIPRLLELRRRVHACAEVLADAVTALVASGALATLAPPAADAADADGESASALSDGRAARRRRGAYRGRPE